MKISKKYQFAIYMTFFIVVAIYEKGMTGGAAGVASVTIIGSTTWTIICSLRLIFQNDQLPRSFWIAVISMLLAVVILIVLAHVDTILKYIMAMMVPGLILGIASYIVSREKPSGSG